MGPQDTADRIWLKQSVQFSVAGQTRTIEIALPVRPGASAEEIERLLRQADAGLDQMTQHLNSKVNELLDQGKTQAAYAAGSSSKSSRMSGSEELAPASERSRSGGIPAGSGVQPGVVAPAAEGAGWSAQRPADSWAATAGPPLDRKQFIAEIAVLGLNPNTAMKRLGLHTLEGVNLRQALEQLRLQLLHEHQAAPGAAAAHPEDADSSAPGGPQTRGAAPPQTGAQPRRPAPELKHASLLSQVAPIEQGAQRALPENDQLLEDEEPSAEVVAPERGGNELLRERAPTPIPIRGARTLSSLQEQVRAKALLDRLRLLRGRLNPPSSDNLKAFRYVVEDQLGAEKTAALLQAVWKVERAERLSPEQVAECIRWGKDDHFEDEVDMLLRLTAAEES